MKPNTDGGHSRARGPGETLQPCRLRELTHLLAALGQGAYVGEQRRQAGGDERSFQLGPVQTASPRERGERLVAGHLLMEWVVWLPPQHLHLCRRHTATLGKQQLAAETRRPQTTGRRRNNLTSSLSCLLQKSIMGFLAPLADHNTLKAAL